jgi:hypothetical protein
MKKFKLKKIIVFVLWIIGISSFAALLGFVNAEEKEVMGQSINVIVTNESENSFIDENSIHFSISYNEKKVGAFYNDELVAVMALKHFKDRDIVTKFCEKKLNCCLFWFIQNLNTLLIPIFSLFC